MHQIFGNNKKMKGPIFHKYANVLLLHQPPDRSLIHGSNAIRKKNVIQCWSWKAFKVTPVYGTRNIFIPKSNHYTVWGVQWSRECTKIIERKKQWFSVDTIDSVTFAGHAGYPLILANTRALGSKTSPFMVA